MHIILTRALCFPYFCLGADLSVSIGTELSKHTIYSDLNSDAGKINESYPNFSLINVP